MYLMIYFGFVIVDLVLLYVGGEGKGVYLINGLLDLLYSHLLSIFHSLLWVFFSFVDVVLLHSVIIFISSREPFITTFFLFFWGFENEPY
jgi:hypothetical protein